MRVLSVKPSKNKQRYAYPLADFLPGNFSVYDSGLIALAVISEVEYWV